MAERVADYPRPPALRASHDPVRVELFGQLLCDTVAAGGDAGPLAIWKVCETFHPPTIYLPPASMRLELLQVSAGPGPCGSTPSQRRPSRRSPGGLPSIQP